MTKRWRILAGLLFMGLLAAITVQAARSFAAALERPRLYSYFDEALTTAPETLSAVDWVPPAQTLDRAFEKTDAAAIGRRLTEAWASLANAQATGKADYLPDQFSAVALTRAQQSVSAAGAQMVVLHQTARPLFYHRDGSLLQLEAQALTARFLLQEDGNLGAFRLSRDATVTTLMNEAVGWRVFSHQRLGADAVEMAAPKAVAQPLRGINYYPANAAWTQFWPSFDRKQVVADFAWIKELGGNSVRIFLQREAFLDPTEAPRNLANLQTLLDDAGAIGLTVVPTLFDMRGGYEPGRWANDYLWLQAVLPVLAGSDVVAFVDLKNEPDLDFATHGQGLVEAWLRSMAAAARDIAPNLRLSVGWSSPAHAADLVDVVDVVSYHDYQPLDGTAERLADVRAQAPGKPVYVTEIGASSWSILLGLPHSPDDQAATLQARLDGLQAADGVFVWTLHDFPKPDPVAIGRSPWRLGLQSQFGLIDKDGTEKPSAAVVRAAFANYFKELPQ